MQPSRSSYKKHFYPKKDILFDKLFKNNLKMIKINLSHIYNFQLCSYKFIGLCDTYNKSTEQVKTKNVSPLYGIKSYLTLSQTELF